MLLFATLNLISIFLSSNLVNLNILNTLGTGTLNTAVKLQLVTKPKALLVIKILSFFKYILFNILYLIFYI